MLLIKTILCALSVLRGMLIETKDHPDLKKGEKKPNLETKGGSSHEAYG